MDTTFIFNPLAVPRTPPAKPARRTARQRAYNRALRAAEQAAWEAADPKAITRLPRGADGKDHPARAFFALLVFSGVAALVFGSKTSLNFAAAWDGLVTFIRHAFG